MDNHVRKSTLHTVVNDRCEKRIFSPSLEIKKKALRMKAIV